jgi:ABC-type multidrug transport system fused ATPase/permease subunit
VINADVIYVIHNGEIVQSGSHDELLKTGGLYAELVNEQFSVS